MTPADVGMNALMDGSDLVDLYLRLHGAIVDDASQERADFVFRRLRLPDIDVVNFLLGRKPGDTTFPRRKL